MATCSEIYASNVGTKTKNETLDRPKKIFFGVFFDGTGNNMIQFSDAINYRKQQGGGSWWEPWKWDNDWEVSKDTPLNEYGANSLGKDPITKKSDYSNIAILHSVYRAMDEKFYIEKIETHNVYRYNIYIEGPGQEEVSTHTIVQDSFNLVGSGFGRGSTGVVALVSKAVAMVRTRIDALTFNQDVQNEIHFDVFGFSRGAACARLFSYLVGRSENGTLNCEDEFKHFQAKRYYENNSLVFLNNIKVKKTVDFLGIYDTVPSINTSNDFHNNCSDYGLFSPNESWVLSTFHICAMDEYRYNFGLTDIGDAVNIEGNAEFFIPGCHSDVGGGYPEGEFAFGLPLGKKMRNGSVISEKIDENGEIFQKMGWYNPNKDSLTAMFTDPVEETMISSLNPMLSLSLSRMHDAGYIKNRYIRINKKTKQGYNVIPLRMMAGRAKTKISRGEIWGEILESRFANPPEELKNLSDEMTKQAEERDGRQILKPEQFKYPYPKLRSNFLHFTSTIDDIKGKLVNYPSYDEIDNVTLCRYLYSGNNGDTERYFVTKHGIY